MKTKCTVVIVIITMLSLSTFNCYSSTVEEVSLTIVYTDSGTHENKDFRSLSSPFSVYIQGEILNVYNSMPYYNISFKIINNSTGEEMYYLSVTPENSTNVSITLENFNAGTYSLIITNYDKGYYCYGTFSI